MRDHYLSHAELTDEKYHLHRYNYYLTIDEYGEGEDRWEAFGVRIDEEGGPQAVARALSTEFCRVIDLCHALIRCRVTPTTLMDVISDWK